ncbi:MAG TPA: MliC family protein, partial [Candidatus Methylomirabilis sp.]|nr:MliC family protein [Candidatus Methylomirabilis sp.]
VAPGEPPIPTGSVKIVLSDGRNFDLPQTISADGSRYANSDESFVFWSVGDGALVLENNAEKDYTGCVVQPTQSSPTEATSTWKIYRSDVYGFEFKYPAVAEIMVQTPSNRFGTGTGFEVGGPDTKAIEVVDVTANISHKTLKQVFEENYNQMKAEAASGADFSLKDFSTLDLKVGGQAAKELFIDHFGDSGSTMVSIVNNGYVYLISGGLKKGDLDQFLSTFKFTK